MTVLKADKNRMTISFQPENKYTT